MQFKSAEFNSETKLLTVSDVDVIFNNNIFPASNVNGQIYTRIVDIDTFDVNGHYEIVALSVYA